MMSLPLALTSFEHIICSGECKWIALFLDYDGTLPPIVDNPDFAIMSNEVTLHNYDYDCFTLSHMLVAVKNASKYFPTAIISRRSREKLYKFVKLTGLYYAGSHAMDIIGPVKKDNIEDGHPNHTITTDKLVRDIPFLHIQILKPFVVNFFCTLYLLFNYQTSFCHFAT
ncbi:unnamed protein product [Musa acuminata subsp. malaccensis]|uniref:(wild Malaysian banana) hypothetical protein n=1 Tax=Musa acuminata subsp. malaccensis TaxID=214687 RepID=A0A8D7BAF7_MUSAM|nr:unnamed protein product [Musa acuminata subsp. malaccensis]